MDSFANFIPKLNNWNGIHGYTQEALANGASRAEVSLNMGHSREEITGHYLKE